MIYVHRFIVGLLTFVICATLLVVFPQPMVDAQCITNDRAEGLISTPESVNKFGNPKGFCIVGDPRASFAAYEIPTYDQFYSSYYVLPKSLPSSAQHGFNYVTEYSPPGGTATESYFNGGTGAVTGNSVYSIKGSLSLGGNIITPANTMLVIFVDQDLNINSDFTSGSSNTGGVVFVVKGNININYLVARVDAVLISAGQNNNYSICTSYDGSCPLQFRRGTTFLTVNGTMASLDVNKPIRFRRSINDNSRPAEIVNFQAKYLFLLKDIFSDSKRIQSEVTDYDVTTGSGSGSGAPLPTPNYSCQDQCSAGNLLTNISRDAQGNCNTNAGVSHTCPSATYNNQNFSCGGLTYKCSGTWQLVTGQPAAPSSSPSTPNTCAGTCTDGNGEYPNGGRCSEINYYGLGYCTAPYGFCSRTCGTVSCNATPTCSATCTAPDNSCSTNNGLKSCTYTTNNGSTNCVAAPAPAQPCTADKCNASTGFTCQSGSCALVACNATPTCSATCSAPANSCSTNNGTKTCNYTTYNGSTSCRVTAAPAQPCTQDTCSATPNRSCQAGTCKPTVTTYNFDNEFTNTQGPIWFYKARYAGSLYDMLWGVNPWRPWNGCCYWYASDTYSIISPSDMVAHQAYNQIYIYWRAPFAGSANIQMTAKNWDWNGNSCGDGWDWHMYHVPNLTAIPTNIFQGIAVAAHDTSLKSMNATVQMAAGESMVFSMYSKNDPCDDDIDPGFIVTLTPP